MVLKKEFSLNGYLTVPSKLPYHSYEGKFFRNRHPIFGESAQSTEGFWRSSRTKQRLKEAYAWKKCENHGDEKDCFPSTEVVVVSKENRCSVAEKARHKSLFDIMFKRLPTRLANQYILLRNQSIRQTNNPAMKLSTSFALFVKFSLCSRAYSFSVPPSSLTATAGAIGAISKVPLPTFHLEALAIDVEDEGTTFPGLDEPAIILTETEIELIARNLKETIDFPFLPNALEKQIIKGALTEFCKLGPVAMPKGLFEELVSGNEDWDNIREEVIHDLNDVICIPIVSRDVQDKIVDSICTVMFTSKSEKAARRQMIGRALQNSLNQDSEEEFATMLNNMVDIPMMNEEQEQVLMRKLVKRINKAFETMVPEDMREVLTHSSPEDLREARAHLIDRLNEKIDIPFKTEKEERVYFSSIVDFLLKRYGLAKGTKAPWEELKDVEKELGMVDVELEVQESIYQKKLEELENKKQSLALRKAELEDLVENVSA